MSRSAGGGRAAQGDQAGGGGRKGVQLGGGVGNLHLNMVRYTGHLRWDTPPTL